MGNFIKQRTEKKRDLLLMEMTRIIYTGILFIIIGGYISHLYLKNIKDSHKEVLGTQLIAAPNSVIGFLDIWAELRKEEVSSWADSNILQDTANNVDFDKWIKRNSEYDDKYIIDEVGKTYKTLGTASGATHDLYQLLDKHPERKEFLNKVYTQSQAVISRQMIIENSTAPVMFVASRIKNFKKTLALVFKIDPNKSFSKLHKDAQIGKTGETYAFNKSGYLLSESRFLRSLIHKFGFLAPDETGILNIQIRDPGGDITKGFIEKPSSGRPLTKIAQLIKEVAENKYAENLDKADIFAGLEGYPDYRGVKVMGVGKWNKTFEMGIATEIDYDEALKGYNGIFWFMVFCWALIILLFVVYSFDLYKHRFQKIKLMESNLFLKSILDSSSSVSIISTDAQGKILFWNKGAENQLGYKSEEMTDRENIKIIYPEKNGRSTLENSIAEVLQSGKTCQQEVEEVTRNGHRINVSITMTPRIDERGKVEAILGIGEDITEKVQTRKKLKKGALYLKLVEEVFTVSKKNDTVKETAKHICDLVCFHMSWAVGSFVLIDKESLTLNTTSSPLDSEELKAFLKIRQTTFNSQGMTILKQVIQTESPIFSNNLIEEFDIDKRILTNSGIKSGFWFPVFIENNVVGVLEFFSLEVEELDKHLLQVINRVSSILVRNLEYKRIKINLTQFSILAESFKGIIDAMNKSSTSEEIIQTCLDRICSATK
jgi:PAS domain S-box-containing protein